MLKSWVSVLGVILLLVGCAAPAMRTNKKAPLPPDWDSEIGPVHEIEHIMITHVPTNRFKTPPTNTPVVAVAPAVATNPPATRPVVKPAPLVLPETGMIALSRWAAVNNFGEVRVLALNPPAYSVKTTYGNFTARPNSLSAYWGRVEVRLGFHPQLIGNQIYLHALDVKKVLEPLATGNAVSTPVNRVVVIDPGHGGANSGTLNVVTGRHEKDYTLDWALRLAPLLEQSGWRVVLTRTNDIALSLAERVAFAEAKRADLFLSLHFNATGDGSEGPAGLETYCLTPAGMPSSITRGYDDDESVVLPNNAYDIQNLRYAMRLHTALLQVNGQKDRGVRHARFLTVLTGQNRPAVLIEGAYLSNPTEARQVADGAFRQKLAEAVAKALE